MRLTAKPLAAILFVVLFGGISLSSALGWWQTTTTKTPVRYTEGEAAGEYNPADIRGSYTFGDVADLFQVPLEDLAAAFEIPAEADPAAYPLKSLESLYEDLPVEVGTASVRLFVAFYRGLPFDLSEDAYLLPSAVRILEQKAALDETRRAYLASHQADAGEAAPAPLAEEPAASESPTSEFVESTPTPEAPQASETEHTPEDRTVTGKTTFQDLLDWGVPQTTIEAIIGAALPNAGMLVKDFSNQAGLSYPTLKTQLQDAVDAVEGTP